MKVIQLPLRVPGVKLRQTTRVCHGFLVPVRAASSKAKCRPGLSAGRCESKVLRVYGLSLHDPPACSLCSPAMPSCTDTFPGSLVAEVPPGRALPCPRHRRFNFVHSVQVRKDESLHLEEGITPGGHPVSQGNPREKWGRQCLAGLKALSKRLCRRSCCRKAAVTRSQSLTGKLRQNKQLVCQVISDPWSSGVPSQNHRVPPGSSCLLLRSRPAAKPERVTREHMLQRSRRAMSPVWQEPAGAFLHWAGSSCALCWLEADLQPGGCPGGELRT